MESTTGHRLILSQKLFVRSKKVRIFQISFKLQNQLLGVVAWEQKQPLLDYVCAFLPSPLDTENVVGTNPNTGIEEDRKPDEEDKTAALAFKIATDPYVGRLTFFRVYSGKVDAGSYVYNSRSGKKERISRLFQMHSNKQNPVEVIGAGDIGAAVGLGDIS